MINFDGVSKENIKEHNANWPYILDHPYRISIITGFGSWKTNLLFNVVSQQLNFDKIYSYAKDPYEEKYQFFINKRETTRLKHLNDSKAFIEYPKDMNDIYRNIEERNPNKKCKILIAFVDMIADVLT